MKGFAAVVATIVVLLILGFLYLKLTFHTL